MKCRFEDLLFLYVALGAVLAALLFPPASDYVELTALNDAGPASSDFSPTDQVVLNRLEQIFARVTKNTNHKTLSHFEDFGTQLDNIFGDEMLQTEIDWSHIDDTLRVSFPGRDIKDAQLILFCYRAYRLKLKSDAWRAQDRDQDLYKFRIAYFGHTLAGVLFATEHRMLTELAAIEPQAATTPQSTEPSRCLSGDGKQ